MDTPIEFKPPQPQPGPRSNGDIFVTWAASRKAAIASVAVVVTIVITLTAAHASRPHKGAVTIESLQEHVSTAREERKQIKTTIDRVATNQVQIQIEQATIIQTLEQIVEKLP